MTDYNDLIRRLRGDIYVIGYRDGGHSEPRHNPLSTEAAAAISELLANRVQADLHDARRYRWLRERMVSIDYDMRRNDKTSWKAREHLDGMIDDATKVRCAHCGQEYPSRNAAGERSQEEKA